MSLTIPNDHLKSLAVMVQEMQDRLGLLQTALINVQNVLETILNEPQRSLNDNNQRSRNVEQVNGIPAEVVGSGELNGEDSEGSNLSDTDQSRKRKYEPPPPPPSPEPTVELEKNESLAIELKNGNETLKPRAKKIRKFDRDVAARRTFAFGSSNEAQFPADIVERKNIDPSLHIKNPLYNSLCIYCNIKHKFLTTHYAKNHSQFENPLARLSPESSHKLRAQTEKFEINNYRIEGFCFFCDETRSMPKGHWTQHIAMHTGENQFTCMTCDGTFKRQVDQIDHNKSCAGDVVNVFELNSRDNSLMAYMCKACNYIQIHESSMKKHMTIQHGFDSTAENYEKVVFIPDLSPIQSMVSERYRHTPTEQRYKCTICDQKLASSDEFKIHFDKRHTQVKQYNCFCGETVNKGDAYVNGKSVVGHLLMHSAKLHQCMICRGVYLKKIHVRSHILHEHPNGAIKYQQVSRNSKDTIVSETNVYKFKCNICKEEFGGIFNNILEHFKEKHPSNAIDTVAILSKKQTRKNGQKKVTEVASGIHFNVQFESDI